MKKMFFVFSFLLIPLFTLAQTPSRSGITVETKEATIGQTAVNLEGYLSDYRPLTQSDGIQVWFRVRKQGDTTWGATGGGVKRGGFSPTFTYPYTGAFTGTGCEKLEYQAVAQYLSVLRSTYQDPPEYLSDIGTFDLTAISNRPNAPIALGDIKLLEGTANCEEDPGPSTTSTGEEDETTGDNTYVFLTPLPFNDGLNPQESVIIGATGEEGILGILQRIFTLMLVAAVVLAVVFMIIGGARYATGDTLGGVQGGRQIITNAVTGLLFALLAWLLLNVINPDLLRFTLVIPNVGSKLTPGTGNSNGGTGGDGPCADLTDEECFEEINEDEERVRQIFEEAGITINKEPCSEFGEQNCTNVGKLNQTVIDEVLKLKQECDSAKGNCALVITGGTEYWLHGEGGNHKNYTAVDFSLNDSNLNSFIRSQTSVTGNDSWCHGAFRHERLFICDEKSTDRHWHADLRSSGGGSTSGRLIKFENIGKNNLGVYGKASRQPITPSDVDTLVTSARSKSWYPEVQRVAGSNAKILTAIIMVESSGDPDEVRTEPDGRKSCGLGQLLTNTAKDLDSSLRNKSVDEICTALKDPSYNIRLSNQYYRSLTGDFKTKVAAYNGGSGNEGATGQSQDCEGLMRFECPWEEEGCYDPSKPNDEPTNTSCQVNTGYEVTRFYVDKVKKISDEL